jgi:uncharacterized repeat protein (TIGR01451 family)
VSAIPRRLGAVSAVGVLAAFLAWSPHATAAPPPPGAAAEAYGLDVDVTLANLVDVNQGPFARSTQEYPPQASGPDTASVLNTGPVPASGQVIQNIGVIQSSAEAKAGPVATAEATAAEVSLLGQNGIPLVTADVISATSTSDCVENPSGSAVLANLRVSTIEGPIPNPGPNTPLLPQLFDPLGIRIMLNEQHPTADGRGFVVNALHVYNLPGAVVPPVLTGDIIISHAMSTVVCPNGAPTTGGDNDMFIVKDADKATAKPGETVTYTATFQNKSDVACGVNQAIDHLPAAFQFVSTSGALGTVADTVDRPGGGQDVVIKPEGISIPAGGSATQTFVVTVREDAAPGTYYNNVEILCAGIGNWVKGLDAPVTVPGGDDPDPTDPPEDLAECEDGKDNDGDGKIDYPADPGCASKDDDDETNIHPHTGGPEDLSGPAALLLVAALYVFRRREAL